MPVDAYVACRRPDAAAGGGHTIYVITDWHVLFETAETRKLTSLRWVPMPNKMDGLGFRRMAAQPDAPQLFAGWCLLVEVASRGRPSERGKLIRGGKPLRADDLALMTGFPQGLFERAFDFFSDPSQGWLSVETSAGDACRAEDAAMVTPVDSHHVTVPADAPGPSPGVAGSAAGRPGDAPGRTLLNGKKERKSRTGKNPAETSGGEILASPTRETWLTPVSDRWAATIGGQCPTKLCAKVFSPTGGLFSTAPVHSPKYDRILVAFENYLGAHRGERARYIDLHKFAATWPQWLAAPPPTAAARPFVC